MSTQTVTGAQVQIDDVVVLEGTGEFRITGFTYEGKHLRYAAQQPVRLDRELGDPSADLVLDASDEYLVRR